MELASSSLLMYVDRVHPSILCPLALGVETRRLKTWFLIICEQELFDNNHRIVTQKGGSGGRFTFTAAEAGDHKICFTPSSDSGKTGWLSTSNPNGGIKLTLDMTIGETSVIESSDKDKLEDIQTRVKDLNSRLQDIRREQVFQRVCRTLFR